jgi:hypothetical protein
MIFIAIAQILYYVMKNKFKLLIFFCIIGGVLSMFIKSLTIVIVLTLLITNILAAGLNKNSRREGMEDGTDNREVDKKKEDNTNSSSAHASSPDSSSAPSPSTSLTLNSTSDSQPAPTPTSEPFATRQRQEGMTTTGGNRRKNEKIGDGVIGDQMDTVTKALSSIEGLMDRAESMMNRIKK